MQRVCTIEDLPASEIIISHCKRGEDWNTFIPVYEVYSYLNKALFTLAVVAISTIVGSLSTAGVALAMDNITKAEATRVMQVEANTRGIQNEQNIKNFIKQNNVTVTLAAQLDNHKYLSTLLARSTNNLFNANEMMNNVEHMLTLKKE